MRLPSPLAILLLPALLVASSLGQSEDTDAQDTPMTTEERLDHLQVYVANLARQLMLQQFASEQRARIAGYSGVKAIRGSNNGPLNYYSASFVGNNILTIHDHPDFVRTLGMGELNVVMNGVEFTTRHNDYQLVMPSTTSTDYHATVDIPFPEVPDSVADLKDVDAQIAEMREYFKAFATQNSTHRDYKPYFPANLCYLEGAWTLDESIEEPFQSDRHQLDAASWLDLQSKIRYGAYTGTKSPGENFADLPTTIMYVNKTTGEPVFAQWNYRIVCSPIKQDLPFSVIKEVQDLKVTYPHNRVDEDNRFLRSQRFILYDKEHFAYELVGLLDRIFYNITGKDNVPSGLNQESYGEKLYQPGSNGKKLQDTSRYARAAELGGKDAMGNNFLPRGFNDPNMWCAETTQPRVAPIISENIVRKKVNRKWKRVTEYVETRFSYAIPLEIVYMTPLLRWNPYNIHHNDTSKTSSSADGRTGANENKAYKGTDRAHYYRTPSHFFQGGAVSEDNADTAKNAVWVEDASGTPRQCVASGTRIITRNIEGVGKVRLRYPIAPVYGEGSAVWKELNALKDFVFYLEDEEAEKVTMVNFQMSVTTQNPPGEHYHEFDLSVFDFKKIRDDGERRNVTTTLAQGHTHDLEILYKKDHFEYKTCSGRWTCKDGHPKLVTPDPDTVAKIE